jgi:hypothetical protein
VTITLPVAPNQILSFDDGTSQWVNQSNLIINQITITNIGTGADIVLNSNSANEDLDFNTANIVNANIDAGLITSGILGIARGGTGNGANIRGDILYAPADDVWSRLPIGAINSFLRSDGTDVSWQTISLDTLSDVIITAPVATQVLTFNGSAWVNQSAAGGVSFPIRYPREDVTIVTGNATLDGDGTTGNAKYVLMDEDINIIIDNALPTGIAQEIILTLQQDGTGGHSILGTSSSEIVNLSTMQALLNQNADAITIFRMMTTDGGTNWFGEVVDFQIPDQTPWTQNINGDTFELRNTGNVAINNPVTVSNKPLFVGIQGGAGFGVRFADGGFGQFDFLNGSSVGGIFLPTMRGFNNEGSATEPGVILDGVINTTADGGNTIPVLKLRAFSDLGTPVAIANRPIMQIVNGFPETLLWTIQPSGDVIQTGNLDLEGNQLILSPDGDTRIQAGTNDLMQFTVDDSVTFSISPTSSVFINDVFAPNLDLSSAGASEATFTNTTSTPPNFTPLGNIPFEGEDSIGTDVRYSMIQGRAEVTSSGNRQGGLIFWVARNSTTVNTARS